MHIALDCRSIHRHMGGIGRAACELVRHLGAAPGGHRITALRGADAPQDFPASGVEFLQVQAGMVDEHFEQLGLPGVLQEIGADLYVNTTFSIPAIKTTRYQVAVIHDVVFEDNPEWVEPSLRGYLQRWSRFAAAHADQVITVSDHARSRICEVYGLAASKVSRIYNGIGETAFIAPSMEEVANVRRKYGLENAFLLYIGTREPKKGIAELLRAFAHVVSGGFAGSLVLAGAGGDPRLDSKAAAIASGVSERTRILGYVTDEEKRALFGGCALFVYPSRYEGFGLPPLEALALGKPCVVSNATSIPEIVGDAALITDVTDTIQFAAALTKGLQDTDYRLRAKEAGPKRAKEFTWPRAATEFIRVFESLESR